MAAVTLRPIVMCSTMLEIVTEISIRCSTTAWALPISQHSGTGYTETAVFVPCRFQSRFRSRIQSRFQTYWNTPFRQPTCVVSQPVDCYHPHSPSPFIIMTQPESGCSFYRPTKDGRLSRPTGTAVRTCSPYRRVCISQWLGYRDKHNCGIQYSIL